MRECSCACNAWLQTHPGSRHSSVLRCVIGFLRHRLHIRRNGRGGLDRLKVWSALRERRRGAQLRRKRWCVLCVGISALKHRTAWGPVLTVYWHAITLCAVIPSIWRRSSLWCVCVCLSLRALAAVVAMVRQFMRAHAFPSCSLAISLRRDRGSARCVGQHLAPEGRISFLLRPAWKHTWGNTRLCLLHSTCSIRYPTTVGR